jgi:GNAT superfamily N-acetyltransferase
MGEEVIFREMEEGEEEAVCDLCRRVLAESVFPDLPEEGCAEFWRLTEPMGLAGRVEAGNLVFVAVSGGRPVAMVEIQRPAHILLFCVDRAFQRRGLGRALFGKAIETCCPATADLNVVTVSSTLNAVPFYEKIGFTHYHGDQRIRNLVPFLPMVYRTRSCGLRPERERTLSFFSGLFTK